MKDFKSKYGPWAVVAGASEGLGEAFARDIASRGINVYLIARREEKLKELTGIIQRDYKVQAQYRKSGSVRPRPNQRFFSQLDVDAGLVVYNAAYAPVGRFAELPAEDPEKDCGSKCPRPCAGGATCLGKNEKTGKRRDRADVFAGRNTGESENCHLCSNQSVQYDFRRRTMERIKTYGHRCAGFLCRGYSDSRI